MTRRFKIMFVIDSLGAGGAELSLVELLPHLIEVGVDPVVVTLKSADVGFEEDARATGVRILQVDEANFIGRVRALRKLTRAEKPDLVHTTLFDSDIAGRLACAGLNVTVSTSLVNTSYDRVRYDDPNVTRWKLELARRIDGWTARHLCDHFHAITNAVESASIEALDIDPDNITVIPRGRDLSRLGMPSEERRARVRNRLGLVPDQPVLLNIGRHEYQKGQRHLIEAVALLREEYGDLALLIAGREGNATRDLQRTIHCLDLGTCVLLLGHRPDIGDLLSATDIFVFPSVFEGLGGALIEAASLATPIVATDLPSIREILGDCYPYLVPPADPVALADAVKELLLSGQAKTALGEHIRCRLGQLAATRPQQTLAATLAYFAAERTRPSSHGVNNQ